ncbi:DUF4158 domain-containing protein [Nonomuraea sp. NPDC050536]|uniref:DUF4158 domain-containing protein n=1 Tax=Nonomuraea sp. NPDC050536 TaxID=3364366 RepID=UPI0037CC7FA3
MPGTVAREHHADTAKERAVPTNFLSDEQRRRFGRFTEDPDEGQLAGSFLLDQAAQCRAMTARGARNRIDWAIQLEVPVDVRSHCWCHDQNGA